MFNCKRIFIVFTALLFFISIICLSYFNRVSISVYNLDTPTQTLKKIDELQATYFSIIKRNNVLLQVFDSEEYQRDMSKLNKLFLEVEKNIDKNNAYLQKYYDIEQKYSENTGKNTYEINMFISHHYDTVDKLLNETYRAVKNKISQDEFNELIKSELQWLKDVEDYNEVFEEQTYGTMRTMVKLQYEINMRKFRTLLLMLYL